MTEEQYSNHSIIYNEHQTQTELQATFQRGETFIRSLIDDLDNFNDTNPEVYANANIFSKFSQNTRRYYSAIVLCHYMTNKTILEKGTLTTYDRKEALDNFETMIRLQMLMEQAQQIRNTYRK